MKLLERSEGVMEQDNSHMELDQADSRIIIIIILIVNISQENLEGQGRVKRRNE